MALGETAIHTSPPHHYERLWSLLPSRLSAFPVNLSLLYAFPVTPSIYFPLLFCWIQTYCGIIDSAGSLLRLLRHSNRVISCLYFGYICSLLDLRVRRVIPMFSSSELSSIRTSFGVAFQAELSSNPSLSEGSTTAKGLYANIVFVLSHYAFGGVSALRLLLALSTPLRPRGRTGVFRRREGPPRKSIPDIPFLLL